MNSDLVAASLAMSTAPGPIEGEPRASMVTRAFSDKNDMSLIFSRLVRGPSNNALLSLDLEDHLFDLGVLNKFVDFLSSEQ